MTITAIVAISRNRAIGRNGQLPWHYSSDLRFFKQQTIHHTCVMGRRTYQSISKPLPRRLNIVLTRNSDFASQPSLLPLPDTESVLALREYLRGEMFIIGGASIYQAFAAHITRWLVTEIPLHIEDADTFMPADFLNDFTRAGFRQLEDNLQVVTYERTKKTITNANT